MTSFIPDLSLTVPGDFDSESDSGTATIDTVGSSLHTTSTSTDPSSHAIVTKDVFGASGVDNMSIRFTFQEILGNDMPSNIYSIVRVYDTSAVIAVELAFQLDRNAFLFRFPDFAGGKLSDPIDTDAHEFLICLNRATGLYRLNMDNIDIDTGMDFSSDPFRYVSFGAVDHAAFPEAFMHEGYFTDIEVMDGDCPPFFTPTSTFDLSIAFRAAG